MNNSWKSQQEANSSEWNVFLIVSESVCMGISEECFVNSFWLTSSFLTSATSHVRRKHSGVCSVPRASVWHHVVNDSTICSGHEPSTCGWFASVWGTTSKHKLTWYQQPSSTRLIQTFPVFQGKEVELWSPGLAGDTAVVDVKDRFHPDPWWNVFSSKAIFNHAGGAQIQME